MNNSEESYLTILHVDDDEDDINSVNKLISNFKGVKLLPCNRPGQIKKIAPRSLDISIVDLEYEGKMRDQEVVGIIQDVAPNSRIIVLSNYGTGDAKKNPYNASDVISKTIFHNNPHVLLSSIIKLLGEDDDVPPATLGKFEAVVLEFENAIERWRQKRRIDFDTLLSASFEWIVCSHKTFVFFGLLIFSAITLLFACALIPFSGLRICVILSCLAIGFQCAWQIIESAKNKLLTRRNRNRVNKSDVSPYNFEI